MRHDQMAAIYWDGELWRVVAILPFDVVRWLRVKEMKNWDCLLTGDYVPATYREQGKYN